MNIKIILYDPYPHGMACTNRIHLYAKGIMETGGNVEILIPRPYERDSQKMRNVQSHGCFEGVDFIYTCGTTVRSHSFLMRRLIELRGLFRAAKILLHGARRRNTQAVLFIGNEWLFIVFFKIACRLLKLLFLQEKSEFPFYNKRPVTFVSKCYQNLYTKYIYRCFDGMIVISKPLKEFFKELVHKKAKFLQIPVLVDTSEFHIEIGSNRTSIGIVYCGNMSESQDGVLTLIRSFQLIADSFPHIRLYLIGESRNADDKQRLTKVISQTKLSKRICLTGYISRQQLVKMLCSAKILVLAKPSSFQAAYCFPSKLAEYLSTGNPVVVTNTGEIAKYLVDSNNAYLVEPGSPRVLADKLTFVLQHRDEASKVGQAGLFLAETHFAYHIHARRLVDFISELYVEKYGK